MAEYSELFDPSGDLHPLAACGVAVSEFGLVGGPFRAVVSSQSSSVTKKKEKW